MEVLYYEIKKTGWDPSKIELEYKYVKDKQFAADIILRDSDGFITDYIDNKNWSKVTVNGGHHNLPQAIEMIKTGSAKYFFRAQEGVYLELIKERFAGFLKKPGGTYGNLKTISDAAEGNFEKVFGKIDDVIEQELKDGDYSSLERFIELKDYK